jgi:thiamine kinase-like enzyme
MKQQYNDILASVELMHSMEASKTSANQMIRRKFAYKDFKEEIDAAIKEIYGDTTAQGTVDWESRVRIMREFKDLPKKELLAKLVEQEGGNKASLTQMLGYIKLCEEWTRQELAAK